MVGAGLFLEPEDWNLGGLVRGLPGRADEAANAPEWGGLHPSGHVCLG